MTEINLDEETQEENIQEEMLQEEILQQEQERKHLYEELRMQNYDFKYGDVKY